VSSAYMSTTTIKFQFNDDIRRVAVDQSKLSYQDLLIKITAIYKNIPQGDVSRITVRYLDNESDMCTVTSDEELEEAFCSFSKATNILKLVISLSESKNVTPNFAPHCMFFKEFGGKWCQFRKLHRDGIALMDEKKYEAARDVFLEQLKEAKNEWQQRFPYYNIACCEALLGNSSVALEYLEKAVNSGFRNLAKIREDPDLQSLRNLEKFQELLNSVAQRKECKGEKDEFRAELRKKMCQEWKNHHGDKEEFKKKCQEWKNLHGDKIERGEFRKKCQEWKNHQGNKEEFHEMRRKKCEEWKKRAANGEELPFRKCHWRKFVKNNCPEFGEQKSEPKVEIETAPLIEKPVVVEEKPAEIVAEPLSQSVEKTLAVFEEMGFLNREQNIRALEKANGDAKLAISVILGL